MISKVRDALIRAEVDESSKIAVAFSGGCDSSALLYALYCLKSEFGFDLCAIHINHGIRGAESDRDETFAAEFCKALSIPCDCRRIDVPSESKKTGESTELCARRMRYDIFDLYVQSGRLVATAHTASDNTETVLFNITRGSGIKGLCGIPFSRKGYIRPLLFCTRDDTERYCRENGIEFVTDCTNLSDDYTRNFIRHNVVPKLKKVNPEIDSAFSSMTEQLREIDQMLEKMCDKAYSECRISKNEFYRDMLTEYDAPVMARTLRIIAADITGRLPDYELTKRICRVAQSGGRTELYGGWFVSGVKNKLRFYRNDPAEPFCVSLEDGRFDTKYCRLTIKITHIVNKLLMKNAIDYDKIIGKAVIRSRASGDTVKLIGRPEKQVRRLMNEMQIPPDMREHVPMIADENGVIFIPYIGIAERVKPDENSKKLIIVTVEGNDND